MNRRFFLKSASAASALAAFPQAVIAASGSTDWVVRGSEGYDAVCFLGPLSGEEFYARYYADEIARFAPRLKPAALTAIKDMKASLAKGGWLLAPFVNLILSSGYDASLERVIHALGDPDTALRPSFAASRYWDEASWRAFMSILPALRDTLGAMLEADFPSFWQETVSDPLAGRKSALSARLADYDLVPQLQRYTGRAFAPTIEVVLLHFCKPHGIRVQGQQFLSAIGWGDDIVIRTAGHEMLHPPVDMNGLAAETACAILEKDTLLQRISAEHDPTFGYNSLLGIFDEDLASALDQIIGEHFGVARDPAVRWASVDGGMHVLSAGFYGLMKRDGFAGTGGNIEDWLYRKAVGGWLAPASLHGAAADVLKRPVDRLWPLPLA